MCWDFDIGYRMHDVGCKIQDTRYMDTEYTFDRDLHNFAKNIQQFYCPFQTDLDYTKGVKCKSSI